MSHSAHFRVDPRLATLLGESYRSSEQALKELVDNAWDADAENVSVTLPESMTDGAIIVSAEGTACLDDYLNNLGLQETLSQVRPRPE